MAGLLIGAYLFYLAMMVGRNTGYQDKNIMPPPAPLSKPPAPPKEERNGWVDELSDPSLGAPPED